MSTVEAGVGPKSRGSSENIQNSSQYFGAPMEGMAREDFESQLLRMQRADIEEARGWNLARHSTSSCIGNERRDLENLRWGSLQWRNENKAVNFDGSFRSEDSDILALWEEKSEAGLDRLGGRRGKLASSNAGRQKPVALGSPWRESVSNAVKRIENLSHAMVNNKEKARTTWPRCSPIHPKAAGLDSPCLLVDKTATGGRSPWREFKITANSSPMRNNSESLLHNSPKARYSFMSPCRRGEFESSPSPITAPELFCQAVTCELQFGPSKPVDFNSRRKDDEREERSLLRDANQETVVSMFEKEVELPCAQAKRSFNHGDFTKPADRAIEPRNDLSNASHSRDVNNPPRAAARTLLRHSTKLSLDSAVEGALPPRFFVEAGEKALSRPCAKLSLKVMSESMERCSAQSMDEALLNEYASEAGGQSKAETLASGERKASHRYYQRVTSAERSSRWSSSDGNFLDAIDFVAPSAARFLEGSDGCVSPVLAPIKTQGAVPFQWEKEPGKPKKHSESAANQSQSALQLPPRLAVSQLKQDPRNRNINVAMIETDALPHFKPSTSTIKLPRTQSNSERTARDYSERVPGKVKSRSIGEVRAALHNLSRQSVGNAGIGDARRQCAGNAPQATLPAHVSGKVRPMSPTSILCGPDDGSRPSSNPSLCSEREAPLISAMIASSLSHGSSPSHASFDSGETMSPESSLTSPLRANSRCNSMSYNDKHQEGALQSGNVLVKFYKNGKRWMKSKGPNSKLGMIPSLEVLAPRCEEPGAELGNSCSEGVPSESAGRPSLEKQGGSEFAARLEGKPSQWISRIDHSNVQTDCRFAPSAVLDEDLGDWSPAYAATLELLSPLQEFSSKQTNLHKKPSGRITRKKTRRMRVRVRVRARFLVPIRRALRKMLSRCAFRRRTRKVKSRGSNLLYHVDYTLSPADFGFSKPN